MKMLTRRSGLAALLLPFANPAMGQGVELFEKQKKEMTAWTEKAKALVPFVQNQQADLLAKATEDRRTDVESWRFECERWGDFLSVKMARRGSKAIISIALSQSPIFVLNEGHSLDLNGEDHFRVARGCDEDTSELYFPHVALPGQLDPSCLSSTHNIIIDVSVKGIARLAIDDKIVFGEGGGSLWDDIMITGSQGWGFSYSLEQEALWKKQRPGATINIPAGLGQETYNKILAAIKAGA